MQNQTKVLIVLVILVLSVGPLSYFFNSAPQQINLPEVPGSQNTSSTRTFEGNLTGEIVNMKPFISYVGLGSTNNEAYVKSIMDSINYSKNYTVKTSLNPYGDGYRYEVTMFLKNMSDMEYVGFKMYVRLSSFLTDADQFKFPRTIGDIQIDSVQSLDNNNVYVKPNTKTQAVMLYSEKIGDRTSVNCPEIITSLNYNLTRITQACVDNRKGFPNAFGASLDTVSANQVTFAKDMRLNVISIDRHVFNFNYTTQNISKIDKDLPNGTGILEIPADANGVNIILVSTNVTTQANVDKIRTAITSNGFNVAEEYKYAFVDIPNSIDFNGAIYYPYKFDVTGIKLGSADSLGMINTHVTFTAMFGEIISVDVQKN